MHCLSVLYFPTPSASTGVSEDPLSRPHPAFSYPNPWAHDPQGTAPTPHSRRNPKPPRSPPFPTLTRYPTTPPQTDSPSPLPPLHHPHRPQVEELAILGWLGFWLGWLPRFKLWQSAALGVGDTAGRHSRKSTATAETGTQHLQASLSAEGVGSRRNALGAIPVQYISGCCATDNF